MKVVLIETTSAAYRENPYSQMDRVLEPLAIEYIGAHLQVCGHEVELIQQIAMDNDTVVDRVSRAGPDVVGFSCMTYAYPETALLAESVKRRMPRVQTMLGGYHVLGMEEGPSCFDFVINGEGELAAERVMSYLAGECDLHLIPGLKFFRGERWNIPLVRADVGRLENPLRLPREEFQSRSMGENTPGTRIACVVAGRGCPYRCDFCCTPQLFPGKRLHRPVRAVVDEIIQLRDEMGVNNINLRDETFSAHRDYLRAFCEEMISRKAGVSWRAFANIGNLTGHVDLVRLMAKAGCHMMFYGVEASDPETWKKRRKNFRSEEPIIEDVRTAQEAGIYVRAGFIVGHENDNHASFQHHAEFLRAVCPDELYISFLTPFPGTPLYHEIARAGRLLTTDLRKYDCEHPVVDIGIPAEELLEMRNSLYRDFYTSPEWSNHLRARIRNNPRERDEIERYAAFVSQKFGVPRALEQSARAASGAGA